MKKEDSMVGCVYFFRHIGLEPIKIGYSSSPSPIDRFIQFKTYAPFGAEIIGFFSAINAKGIESFLHEKYKEFRLKGEWFNITQEEVDIEVNFYSNKKQSKNRHDFQIEWANKVYLLSQTKKQSNFVSTLKNIKAESYVHSLISKNETFSKSEVALQFNISRQSVHRYVKSYQK